MLKRKTLSKLLLVGLVLVLALALAGCPGQQAEETPNENQDNTQNQQQGDNARADIDITALISDWENSAHANLLAYPAGRDNCISCHSGYAFANEITELAKLPEGKKVMMGEGEDAKATATTSTNCTACHTGRGNDLMEAGEITIPTSDKALTAGKSAMCVACHNQRKKGDINDEKRSAPHYSSQGDTFFGTGGMEPEGMEAVSNPHGGVKNPCISCHMTEKNGLMNHNTTLEENSVGEICGKCHSGITTFNREAKADYDGDGKTEGLQDEVKGLLELVKKGIEDKAGPFESEGGGVVFEKEGASKEAYLAAWNYFSIGKDGSNGIHNPAYAVRLLQQSYKTVTGEDIPNAQMK